MDTFTFETYESNKARIKVIGVGGGGTNAVNYMINKNVRGVEFFVANTDMQSLEASPAPNKIQLGSNLTRGLGTGSKPDLGKTSAEEALDKIEHLMENTDMVFITAGMGGGTGTGGAPVFAKIARDHGILTVGVVTKPFSFEQKIRMKNAELGIKELRKQVDTLIVIPNERLLQISDSAVGILEAFDMADNVLYEAVRGISDVIVVPSRVNVDFADVQTIMSNMGDALMGTGYGEGEKAALQAIQNAINCPLLERATVKGAKGLLINYVAGRDLPIQDINEANKLVVEEADQSVEVMWGLAIDESYEKKVKITVIATGFGRESTTDKSDVPFDSKPLEHTPTPHRQDMDMQYLSIAERDDEPIEQEEEVEAQVAELPYGSTITEDEIYNNLKVANDRERCIDLDTPAFLRRGKRLRIKK